MTRLATENFNFWPISTATVGTVTKDTAHTRSGPSCAAVPLLGSLAIVEPRLTATLDRTFFYRVAFRVDALPTSNMALGRLRDNSNQILELAYLTTGEVKLWAPVEGKNAPGSFKVTLGEWFVLEVKLRIPTEGSGKLSWRADGVEKATDWEAKFRNLGAKSFWLGNPGAVTNEGMTVYVDDVAINDDQGGTNNTWAGTEADPIPTPNPVYPGAFLAEFNEATIGTEKAPYDAADVLWDDFETRIGRGVGILHLGDPWTEEGGPEWDGYFPEGRTSEVVHQRGAIMLKDLGGPESVVQDVLAGNYDAQITAWAKEARRYGHPFFLRLWWEMNGTWFNWGRAKCTGAEFVAAWQHFHDLVRAAGAYNVTFVWCPNALFEGHTDPFGDEEKGTESFYPGDAYVDWTGIDGYTGQNPHKELGFRNSKSVFLATYERLQEGAPDKPVMIGETGCSEWKVKEAGPAPPAKAEWISQFLEYTLPYEMPNVRAVVYFNWFISEGGGRLDWPIQTSESAEDAFALALSSDIYVEPAVDAFRSLAPVPLPGEDAIVHVPRTKPPLELDVEVETPDGTFRQVTDSTKAGKRPLGINFSTQRGDGFATGGYTLTRQIFRDYPDINLLDTHRFIGKNGDVAYEGRLHSNPRSNSPESIELSLVGWMTYLKGRTIAPLIIDRRLDQWGDGSTERRAQVGATSSQSGTSVSQGTKASGAAGPSILVAFNTYAEAFPDVAEAWFYASGEDIGEIRYDYIIVKAGGDMEHQTTRVYLAEDDVTPGPGGPEHHGSEAANQVVEAGGEGFKYALLSSVFGGAFVGSSTGDTYGMAWPRVIGNHGLTLREEGAQAEEGYYLSDLIEYLLRTYYPKVNWVGDTNTFVVTQAAFQDAPADGWTIIQRWNDLALMETNMWEDRSFHFEQADLTSYDWQFKTTDPGVEVVFEGDSIELFANGVVVDYTDVLTGKHVTLYPDDHDELRDDSESNPYNRQGEAGWTNTPVPFSCTEAEALQYGRAYLAELNRPKRPGTYKLSGGYIKDYAGHYQQGWKVRCSQTVGILNHPEDFPRLITATQWSQDDLTLTITVDAPPKDLEAVVARQEIARTSRGL